jgi:hypothetical protein
MSYIPKCVDYIFFKKNKSPVIILYSKAQHSKTLIILIIKNIRCIAMYSPFISGCDDEIQKKPSDAHLHLSQHASQGQV